MTDRFLVAYATKHGSTSDVAEAVADELAAAGVAADVLQARRVHSVARYGAVVVGAPIYMGRWHGDAASFVRRFRGDLSSRAVVVFALGPVKEDGSDYDGSLHQFERIVEGLPVEPVESRLFGGVVDPTSFHFPFSRLPASDTRDWDAIRSWARSLPALLSARV